jgi:hypothetical protein
MRNVSQPFCAEGQWQVRRKAEHGRPGANDDHAPEGMVIARQLGEESGKLRGVQLAQPPLHSRHRARLQGQPLYDALQLCRIRRLLRHNIRFMFASRSPSPADRKRQLCGHCSCRHQCSVISMLQHLLNASMRGIWMGACLGHLARGLVWIQPGHRLPELTQVGAALVRSQRAQASRC